MLDISGRRAQYGAVSATTFLHGGTGEGTSMHPGRDASHMAAFDTTTVDRTTTRDFRDEARNRMQIVA